MIDEYPDNSLDKTFMVKKLKFWLKAHSKTENIKISLLNRIIKKVNTNELIQQVHKQ